MMKIKGLGPKKISIIWKEMNVENIGELLYACHENRLSLLKGFGKKTQDNVPHCEQGFCLYLASICYTRIVKNSNVNIGCLI